jgi:hypothetical protein
MVAACAGNNPPRFARCETLLGEDFLALSSKRPKMAYAMYAFGPKRIWRKRNYVAIGGKADMPCCTAYVCF